MHVNYRGSGVGKTIPSTWYWHAGSSSSFANMEFGYAHSHSGAYRCDRANYAQYLSNWDGDGYFGVGTAAGHRAYFGEADINGTWATHYAWMDSAAMGIYGKLFVASANNNQHGVIPTISLAIGDSDSGLNWEGDGTIVMKANGVTVGYWNNGELRIGKALYGLTVVATDGYFTSNGYGRYGKIGNQNAAWYHFETNADTGFYFNKGIAVDGNIWSYGGSREIGSYAEPFSTIYVNNWLRTKGECGWYSETFGGGIRMVDSTWIRTYGNKKLYVENNEFDAIRTAGGFRCEKNNSASDNWGNCLEISRALFSGEHIGMDSDSIHNILGWSDIRNGVGYHTRYSICSCRSYSGWGWMQLAVGNSDNGQSGYALKLRGDGTMEWTGNLLVHGGTTFLNASDLSLKKNLRSVTDASQRLMSLGGIWDFEYISEEVERNPMYAGRQTGLIYQNVKDTCMKRICHVREDGKGSINYIDMSFISLLAAVGMEHETRLQALERENESLKLKVETLERRRAA